MSTDNLEKIKQIDRSLLLIVGISFSLFLYAGFSAKRALVTMRSREEYFKISEFLDNQAIFNKYLDQKRELYWQLNKTAAISLKEKLPEYHTSGLFFALGGWGWSETYLDDRFDFKTVIEDIFFSDWSYWDSRGRIELKTMIRDSSDDLLDMGKRLKRIIKDDNFIRGFLVRNLEIKMFFLKDMIQKYNISLPDTIFSSVEPLYSNDSGKTILSFLNDSTRTTFFITSPILFMSSGSRFYKIHDYYEAICMKVFEAYIKDKYLVYDREALNNKLPYSSYISKIKRRKDDLGKTLGGNLESQDQVKPPYVPFSLDIKIFYYFIFWILFLFSYIMRNFIICRDKYYKTAGIKDSIRGELDDQLSPSLINITVLPLPQKQFFVKALLFIVHNLFIWLVFYSIIGFHDLLYNHTCSYFWLAIVPCVLSPLVFIIPFLFKIIRKITFSTNKV